MVDLLSLQKKFILPHLHEGDTAVDFTMGNGYDTVFLSKTVGEGGKVYAFDIQESALISTEHNLKENSCPDNWHLICASHDRAPEFVGGKIKAGMFNLGYLPGSGHKQAHHKAHYHSSRSEKRDGNARRGRDSLCGGLSRTSRGCA